VDQGLQQRGFVIHTPGDDRGPGCGCGH
jgi:hypothetical protein